MPMEMNEALELLLARVCAGCGTKLPALGVPCDACGQVPPVTRPELEETLTGPGRLAAVEARHLRAQADWHRAEMGKFAARADQVEHLAVLTDRREQAQRAFGDAADAEERAAAALGTAHEAAEKADADLAQARDAAAQARKPPGNRTADAGGHRGRDRRGAAAGGRPQGGPPLRAGRGRRRPGQGAGPPGVHPGTGAGGAG